MVPMIKRMAIMLVVTGVVLGGVFGYQALRSIMLKKYFASQGNPPQTVSTVEARYQDWQPRLEAVGTLRAVNGADLAPEVAGIVDKIYFESGQRVEAGTPLVQLRADDDVAKLDELKAAAHLAQVSYDRDLALRKNRTASQATLDAGAAKLKTAQAQVAAQEAVLARKTIRAPFAGELGIRAVDVGQYVKAGTNLVTLQAQDPIYIDFSLPQRQLNLLATGQAVTAKVDTFPGQVFTGKIHAINSRIDAATRNVQVRAVVNNPERKLRPGMYATVDIAVGARERHITVPQTAISYNPYGNTVYLAAQNGKNAQGHPKFVARQIFVTTGARRGDQIAVLKGIKEGEQVVTAGQIKLRNGTPLLINNAVQPANNPNPIPVEQ